MDLIIKPVLKELKSYFVDLQCTVNYEHKRGRPVAGYTFTFKPEQSPKTAPTDAEPTATEQPSSPSLKSQRNYNPNKPKNQFRQFMQREMTQAELDELEQKLLNEALCD